VNPVCLAALWSCLTLLAAGEAPILSPLFSDHAVLQRGQPIVVSGRARSGVAVVVHMADQTATTTCDANGLWSVRWPAMAAGGPYDLNVTCADATTVIHDLMIGDVWLCAGQSNMGYPMSGATDSAAHLQALDGAPIRLFKARSRASAMATTDFAADQTPWSLCTSTSAAGFSAVALAFAHQVQTSEPVTIGLIQAAKAGSFIEAWIPGETLAAEPAYAPIFQRWSWLDAERETLRAAWTSEHTLWQRDHGERFALWKKNPQGGQFEPHEPGAPAAADSFLRPSVLWNAMIAPLTRSPIRGVVWYQGESNSDRAWQYRDLLRSLIGGWRQAWDQPDLPVIIAQLPEYETDCCPYDYQDFGAWEVLRESQALAAALPHTGLTVMLGLGEVRDIHPREKWEVGKRLGRTALAVAYGKPVSWSGPRLIETTHEGQRMILRFSDVGQGLSTGDGDRVSGCVIAGADQRFAPATAVVVGPDTIVVSAEGITAPQAVRYAWDDAPTFSLRSSSGVMAGPFRTDTWLVPTQGVTAPFARHWPP